MNDNQTDRRSVLKSVVGGSFDTTGPHGIAAGVEDLGGPTFCGANG